MGPELSAKSPPNLDAIALVHRGINGIPVTSTLRQAQGTSELVTYFRFHVLGRAALPLGLLVVGAGLDLHSLRAAISPIILASGLKLFLYPLVTLMVCLWFNIEPEARLIMVMFTALPCAPSAYMLALELGGDEKLMATILTGQTILAILSMPFILSGLTV